MELFHFLIFKNINKNKASWQQPFTTSYEVDTEHYENTGLSHCFDMPGVFKSYQLKPNLLANSFCLLNLTTSIYFWIVKIFIISALVAREKNNGYSFINAGISKPFKNFFSINLWLDT